MASVVVKKGIKIAYGRALMNLVDSHWCETVIDYSSANFSATPAVSLTPNEITDKTDVYTLGFRYGGTNASQCEVYAYSLNGRFSSGIRSWVSWIAVGT